MTMGRRKGLSRVHLIVLVALSALAFVCVFSYAVIARIQSPFVRGAAATNTAPPSLANVALTSSEIEHALQSAGPLTLKSSKNSCDIPKSLECFSVSYTSSAEDLFTLLLARFSSPDGAVDFGIGMQVQQEQEGHATQLDIPTTAGSYRWLDLGSTAGTPVYYGGANANSIAMFMTWGRTSVFISEAEAVQTFSRLLDEQTRKVRSRFSS